MPDSWETQYGLNINYNDSEFDPDEDGRLNLYEYLFNTNPIVWEPYIKSISDKTVDENRSITIKPSLISNPDGNPVEYSINSSLFTWDGTYFRWRPSSTSSGTYAFTITATSGELSDEQSFIVTVNNTCVHYDKYERRWDCEVPVSRQAYPESAFDLR